MKTYTVVFGLSTSTDPGPAPFGEGHFRAVETVARMASRYLQGATVAPAVGTSDEWGQESSVTVLTTARYADLLPTVGYILRAFEQEAAYVTVDGASPALWWIDDKGRYNNGIRIESLS